VGKNYCRDNHDIFTFFQSIGEKGAIGSTRNPVLKKMVVAVEPNVKAMEPTISLSDSSL
jgi:hypothetical protein